MTTRPQVGFHDFLNSKPILHALQHGLVEAPFDLVIDTPSNLAERFHAGDLDIAMIPSVEYGRNLDAVIIPVFCIASLGRVETVLLFSELAMEDIESISADPKSRTSVAMAQILFKKKYGKEPVITMGEDDPEMMLRSADAGLVIGDTAYLIDSAKYLCYDLGELWYQYSGLPFVHAVLCARKNQKWNRAITALREAKDIGLKNRELIAKQEGRSKKEASDMLDYLTKRIYYNFGAEEKSGLQHFLDTALSMGLVIRADLAIYRD